MKREKMDSPLEIGWKEWVSLPDLGVPAVKVKVDTGARTSALHTFHLEPFNQGGKKMVKFLIHPLQKKTDIIISCIAEVKDIRTVRDSGGHSEERFVIQTMLKMGNEQWPIEITLTNRDDMMFRMLLGRTALRNKNIIVNTGKIYLTGKSLYRAYRKKLRESSGVSR